MKEMCQYLSIYQRPLKKIKLNFIVDEGILIQLFYFIFFIFFRADFSKTEKFGWS